MNIHGDVDCLREDFRLKLMFIPLEIFRSNDENADAYKVLSILYGLGKYNE